MNELTQQGIAALKSGDKASARQNLASAVRQNPNDLQAWLWLAAAMDNNEQAQVDCLRQVLRIDPGNTAAARGLASILGQKTRSDAQAAVQEQNKPEVHPLTETGPAELSPAESDRLAAVTRQEPAGEAPSILQSPTQNTEETVSAAASTPVEEPVTPALIDLPADLRAFEQPAPLDSSSQEAVPVKPINVSFYRPTPREELTYANYEKRLVFKTRPSHVPALAVFWIFFIGAAYTSTLLGKDFKIATLFALGLGLLLEAIVMFAVVINFRTRYELTDQELRLHILSFQSLSDFGPVTRDISVPLYNIYGAETQRNFFQQILGIGDVIVNGEIDGRLGHVRMRSIPDCDNRVKQILYLANEHQL